MYGRDRGTIGTTRRGCCLELMRHKVMSCDGKGGRGVGGDGGVLPVWR